MKWNRKMWWCSIHFLNSLFSFQLNFFVLRNKCQYLISWEIFCVPGNNWISPSLKRLIQPCNTRARINPELFTFAREEHIFFYASCLPFLFCSVFCFCVKHSSLQRLELSDSQRGFQLISIGLISALLKCHFMSQV